LTSDVVQNLAGFGIRSNGGVNGRIAEQAIVQSFLGLGSLSSRIVHDESKALIQVQLEMTEWAVLHAQGSECGTVDLRSQILEQQPSVTIIQSILSG